jgi:hypothetical protein
MKLYSGIDLHSTNSCLAIIDENGKSTFKEKLPNDIASITERLSLYNHDIFSLSFIGSPLVLVSSQQNNPIKCR